jgi:hypothetical protein
MCTSAGGDDGDDADTDADGDGDADETTFVTSATTVVTVDFKC